MCMIGRYSLKIGEQCPKLDNGMEWMGAQTHALFILASASRILDLDVK